MLLPFSFFLFPLLLMLFHLFHKGADHDVGQGSVNKGFAKEEHDEEEENKNACGNEETPRKTSRDFRQPESQKKSQEKHHKKTKDCRDEQSQNNPERVGQFSDPG